jgi:hypothetical protein
MATRSATYTRLKTLTCAGLFAGLSGLLAGGCAETPADAPAGDEQSATFGGVALKADGKYTDCELLEVLKLVNESATDVASLKAIGLRTEAANRIFAHHVGPDALLGTADDDVYDSLDELDAVPYVGPKALDQIVGAVRPRCEPDLTTRPFIDSTTFGGSTGGGWERNNVELEGVMTVTGLTGAQLRAILTTKDANGRSEYEKLRKNTSFEAFSTEFGTDEMPWDSASHTLRESFPYTVLTIESERFAVDAASHRRELSLGTDKMDDIYYDTADFQLLKHKMVLRARARWDSDNVVRRLLIGAKFDTGIDPDGLKRTDKLDVRTEGEQHLATLDNDIRRGKVKWSHGNQEEAVAPVKAIYEKLVAANVLPDFTAHQDVLLLDPKARLRSIRSRFHLNEARIDSVRRLHEHGKTRLTQVLALVGEARTAGRITADLEAATAQVETLAKGITDATTLTARALVAAQAVRPETTEAEVAALLPGASAPADVPGLNLRKAVAEAVDALYHEIGDPLDEVERELVGAMNTRFDAYVLPFELYCISVNNGLGVYRAAGPFITAYQGMDPPTSLPAFNTFIETQKAANAEGFKDLTALNEADWGALGLALKLEDLKIARRQIEYAGTLAQALWFDQAREFYVPASDRAWGNFLIDTFDWTDVVTEEEWQRIPETERTIATPLPPEKVATTIVVNELQIELGQETAYVKRIAELETLVANPTPEQPVEVTSAQLAGAKFVFSAYRALLQDLAELKGERVLKRLKRAGAPNAIQWVPAADSKGNIALNIVSDRD